MSPRSLALPVLLASLSIGLPGLARADEEPPTGPENAAPPAPEPGAAGKLPEDAPKEVPPPSSDPPPPVGHGTTSGHHGPGGPHGPPEHGGLVLREGPFELRPGGLLQIDGYGFAGPGVADYQRADGSGLKTNIAARRVRLELAGRVLHRWYYVLQAEYGQDQRFVPNNAFIGLHAHPWFNVQAGQFRIPFMMENVTEEKQASFMERSLTVGAIGAPMTRDLGVMAWGGGAHAPLTWALGWFGGEGGNRPSADNRGNIVGRVVMRPLHRLPGGLRDAHIGVSGRFARSDRNYSLAPVSGMRTPGGYSLWSPTYGSTEVRPGPEQRALAVELFVPLRRLDLRAEAVFVHDERHEVDTKAVAFNNTERSGTLSGLAWYVEASYWFIGQPRFPGNPGNYGPNHEPPRSVRALALTVRFERMNLDYDSIARSYDEAGVLIPGVRRGGLDAQTTELKLNVAQAALSYWATRHVRVMLQWSGYFFPEGSQLTAPGARANGRDSEARVLHEVSARMQLSI